MLEREVILTNIKTGEVSSFDSVIDAASFVGCTPSQISYVIHRAGTVHGYKAIGGELRMRRPKNNKANICFDCQNACGGCSWSQSFTPVPGWTAEKTILRGGGGCADGKKIRWLDTYHITACPEFVPDEKRKPSCGEISEDQMRFLLQHWKRKGEL